MPRTYILQQYIMSKLYCGFYILVIILDIRISRDCIYGDIHIYYVYIAMALEIQGNVQYIIYYIQVIV